MIFEYLDENTAAESYEELHAAIEFVLELMESRGLCPCCADEALRDVRFQFQAAVLHPLYIRGDVADLAQRFADMEVCQVTKALAHP
ncbi:hypothetical protein [Dietzia sp. PP-33]|jgi:hypothetical protein|uniref:hypothetical protein n=1 Tax=Dietzia sp. PP-33 TaxID=2957500 RepID=UPI0029A967D0|nr:hypothetical protein [Dietzia sp. PP-33]MDX2356145.1 hypothetical protein [Dietzia sp. PP-33]